MGEVQPRGHIFNAEADRENATSAHRLRQCAKRGILFRQLRGDIGEPDILEPSE